MPTTTPTSSAPNTPEESAPSSAPPAQDAEPPEPKNTLPLTSSPCALPPLAVTILISEIVPRNHPTLTSSSPGQLLQRNITQAAHLLGINTGCITINLITDEEMIDLHTRFCNDNTTTDILSFDLDDPQAIQQLDHSQPPPSDWSPLALRANLLRRTAVTADLALCLDQAERQADKRNHPLINELTLYAVHGTLHLLGHDDHDPDSYQTMHQLEDEILRSIGLPPTFTDKLATQ